MALIEGIFGEIDSLVEYPTSGFQRDAVFLTSRRRVVAGMEYAVFFLYHIGFLLSHRPPDKVCPPEAVSGKFPHNLHDLFLIDDASIGRGKDFFQLGDFVSDGFGIFHFFQVFGDEVKSMGPGR